MAKAFILRLSRPADYQENARDQMLFVFRKPASAKTLMMTGCGAFYVGSCGGA